MIPGSPRLSEPIRSILDLTVLVSFRPLPYLLNPHYFTSPFLWGRGRGVWGACIWIPFFMFMLLFYECLDFFVWHSNPFKGIRVATYLEFCAATQP